MEEEVKIAEIEVQIKIAKLEVGIEPLVVVQVETTYIVVKETNV
jgi:hypothetical protein